jgi:hypothetical protein
MNQINEINQTNQVNEMNETNQINQMNPNDVRSETLKELRAALEPFLGDRLERMVLFGSMARGDYRDDSDIDVAIVVRRLTRELKHEILDRVAEVELKHFMPVSVLVFSEEDFDRLKRRERRIALDIEREGVPL